MIDSLKNNPTKYASIFLILGFVSALSSSLLSQNYLWDSSYYHLMETSFFFYIFSLYINMRYNVIYNKGMNKFCLFALLCSLSTLLDEIFYDATKVEWNDMIRIVSIFIFVFIVKR